MATSRVTNLKHKIQSRWPIIAITNVHDHASVIAEIEAIASRLNRDLFRWSSSEGLLWPGEKVPARNEWWRHGVPPGADDTGDAPRTQVQPAYYLQPMIPIRTVIGFQRREDISKGAIVVAENLHWYMTDKEVRQLLTDAASALMSSRNPKTLIIIGANVEIPAELEKKVVLIDWSLPDSDELRTLLINKVEQTNAKGNFETPIELGDDEIAALVDATKGMTAMEADNSLNEATVKLRRFDASPEMLRMLNQHKKQVIAKHKMLEYFEPDASLDQVGGADLFKDYLMGVAAARTPGAAAFGVRAPIGVLLAGPPGTGKTLLSRAAGNAFGWGVVRFNLAAVFDGLVGSSETNMKTALATLCAVAPIVVQVDEIEKAMSGKGGDLDGGTSSRVLGIFLTWLQDQMDDPAAPPMFIVATANRAMNLDSALMRRFEDTFFIDLPTEGERAEILDIHLRLAGRDAAALDINLARLAMSTDDYSGAELKKGIDAALRKTYLLYLQGKANDLNEEILAEALGEIVPVAKSMDQEVQQIRKWAQQVRPASSAPRRLPAPETAEVSQLWQSALPDMQE